MKNNMTCLSSYYSNNTQQSNYNWTLFILGLHQKQTACKLTLYKAELLLSQIEAT
jgi:hypothetical protein